MRRFSLAVSFLAVAALLASTTIARADSLMTPATRTSPGQGFEVTAASGEWTFTVAGLQGKPAQVLVAIENVATGQRYWAGDHPQLGKSFDSYQVPPAGTYEVTARLWGGPVRDGDSVTLSIDTP